MELRAEALKVLCISDPLEKAARARALWGEAQAGAALDTGRVLSAEAPLPGRPARQLLVEAVKVPRRSPFTPEGRAALLHSVTHIEFNAIKITIEH